MNGLYRVGGKTRRTMGFALMVAFLSLGVISGCGSSNNDSYDFADSGQSDGSDGSDGGLGGVEDPADLQPKPAYGSAACAADADPENSCCVSSGSLRSLAASGGMAAEDIPAALVTAMNTCYALVKSAPVDGKYPVESIGTAQRSPAQAGVLVHGWDGTDNGVDPWMPGDAQLTGLGVGARWSSSFINNYNVSYPGEDKRTEPNPTPPVISKPSVSIYSVYQGGVILSISDTQINCAYSVDAGTDSRAKSAGTPALIGCGKQSTLLDINQWCGPNCQIGNSLISTACASNTPPGPQPTVMCTIKPQNIAALLVYQRSFSCVSGQGEPFPCGSNTWPVGPAYNEVVVEPDTNPDIPTKEVKNTISAYYNPTGIDYPSDPRVNECGGFGTPWRPLRTGAGEGGAKKAQDLCCEVEPNSRTLLKPLTCKPAPALSEGVTSACTEIAKWNPSSTNMDWPPLLALAVQSWDTPFLVGDCKTIHGIDDCGATTVVPAVCDSAVVSKFALDHPNYVLN